MRALLTSLRARVAERARPSGLLLPMRRFIEDRRGVGGVEFAIVAPMLIMAYVGAVEVSVAMTVNRKVSRASATVSDLLTQATTTDVTKLDTMKDVAMNVLAPFSSDAYTLKITGIAVDAAGKATVAWSRDGKAGTPYTKDDPVTLPDDMDAKSTFIVRTELEVEHGILLLLPSLKASDLSALTLGKTSYFRQRVGDRITCSDCP